MALHSRNTASASGRGSFTTGMSRSSIGFDDALIYDEIPKAIDKRTIPTIKLALPEAKAVFEEWRSKPDKIEY